MMIGRPDAGDILGGLAAMAFLLGTESEALVVGGGGLSYEPAGLRHAVDPASVKDGAGVLAYAACGTPVRVWPDKRFDPNAADVHQKCALRPR